MRITYNEKYKPKIYLIVVPHELFVRDFSEKEMLNLYYSLFNTCEAKYFYYTKEADAWMAEKQNLIARKTGTPIPAAQPTQATPAVPPPFVPTAPAKSHEYYCCLARWDGSYIGYETYKSEQAAQNASK